MYSFKTSEYFVKNVRSLWLKLDETLAGRPVPTSQRSFFTRFIRSFKYTNNALLFLKMACFVARDAYHTVSLLKFINDRRTRVFQKKKMFG